MKSADNTLDKHRNLVSEQKGVAAIEFAMIVPVILLMLVALWNISVYESEKLRLERIKRNLISNIVENFSTVNNQNYQIEKSRIISQEYNTGDLFPIFTEEFCFAELSDCVPDCDNCQYLVVTLTGSQKVQTPLMGDKDVFVVSKIKILSR